MCEVHKTVEEIEARRKPTSEAPLAATHGSASAWKNQVVALEIKTDRLRESAYKAGCFQLAADLQDVKRALYKIRAQEIQTPNSAIGRLDAIKPL